MLLVQCLNIQLDDIVNSTYEIRRTGYNVSHVNFSISVRSVYENVNVSITLMQLFDQEEMQYVTKYSTNIEHIVSLPQAQVYEFALLYNTYPQQILYSPYTYENYETPSKPVIIGVTPSNYNEIMLEQSKQGSLTIPWLQYTAILDFGSPSAHIFTSTTCEEFNLLTWTKQSSTIAALGNKVCYLALHPENYDVMSSMSTRAEQFDSIVLQQVLRNLYAFLSKNRDVIVGVAWAITCLVLLLCLIISAAVFYRCNKKQQKNVEYKYLDKYTLKQILNNEVPHQPIQPEQPQSAQNFDLHKHPIPDCKFEAADDDIVETINYQM